LNGHGHDHYLLKEVQMRHVEERADVVLFGDLLRSQVILNR